MSSVADRYNTLVDEVADIARACGRAPEGVKVIAVTKTWPLDHVMPAYEAGCRDFGENRVQELLGKVPEVPSDLNWHLIGTLQRNKVKQVVGKVALIHAVDSVRLAQEVAKQSTSAGVVTPILLQANTSGEASKHGMTAEEWKAAIEEVVALDGVVVSGLMTMAPLTEDESVVRKCFGGLRELRDVLQAQVGDVAVLGELSMGMSHDYRIAIEEGATLVRVGSALFGARG